MGALLLLVNRWIILILKNIFCILIDASADIMEGTSGPSLVQGTTGFASEIGKGGLRIVTTNSKPPLAAIVRMVAFQLW